MPDPPKDQTPTDDQPAQPTADELLKELADVKKDLAATNQASAALREAFVEAVQTTQRHQSAEPAPADEPDDIPTPEDFDEDHAQATARLAATMIKRGLSEYHQTQSAENASLRDAVLSMEWEKVRAEDPKNFDRLSKHINQALNRSEMRRPGAVRQLFYSLRGQYMPQLQEMDRKEKLAEPVPNPNPPVGEPPKEPEKTTLTAGEIEIIRGLRQNPNDYYRMKYGKDPDFADGYLTSVGLPEAKQ